MKEEQEIKRFLEMLKEKQKEYKPWLVGKKKGLNYDGEIMALEWVLEMGDNVQGVCL